MHTHNRATNLTYTKSLFHIFLHLFIHRIVLAFGEKLTHLGARSLKSTALLVHPQSPLLCRHERDTLAKYVRRENNTWKVFVSVLFWGMWKVIIKQRPGCQLVRLTSKWIPLILHTCHSVTRVQINVPLTCDSGDDNVSLLLTKHLEIMIWWSYGCQYKRFMHTVDQRYATGLIMSLQNSWLCNYN